MDDGIVELIISGETTFSIKYLTYSKSSATTVGTEMLGTTLLQSTAMNITINI